MRYDIYAALTAKMNRYQLGSPERKILQTILPSELERKIDSIATHQVEFNLADEKEIEAIAVAEENLTDSAYQNTIDFSIAFLNLKDNNLFKDLLFEEIIGFSKITADFHYSYLEIINNGLNTLLVGGTVIYKVCKNDTLSVKSAKLGKWIYDNNLIEEVPALKSFCTTKLSDVDVYDKLLSFQKSIRNCIYAKPEDYVTITINDELDPNTIIINNDGEIEKEANFLKNARDIFSSENNETNPQKILKELHQLSNVIYLPDFAEVPYCNFRYEQFINEFSKIISEKDKDKAKQFQKKKNSSLAKK